MEPVTISDAEFAKVQALAMSMAGISLPATKKTLVISRWGKRLTHHGLRSYSEYLKFIQQAGKADELQISLDLLTTNETYFFREPQHFDFLRKQVLPRARPGGRFRVWSAASSTGEEAYSVAMLLGACVPHLDWEILGTDISTRVLEVARKGLYEMQRIEGIPKEYLQRFCMKGTGPYAGKLLIDPKLRDRVRFERANLNESLPKFGEFDVIFLRNVMIYFDMETKAKLIERLTPFIKPGGYLFIGHCDSLQGISGILQPVQTAVYRKPAA